MTFSAALPCCDPPDPELPLRVEEILYRFWKSIKPGCKPTISQLKQLAADIRRVSDG